MAFFFIWLDILKRRTDSLIYHVFQWVKNNAPINFFICDDSD